MVWVQGDVHFEYCFPQCSITKISLLQRLTALLELHFNKINYFNRVFGFYY